MLYFGKPPDYPTLSKGKHDADDLGGPICGEIRLYQQNPSPDIEQLWNEVAAGEWRDAAKQPTQLTADHALHFQAIRESGTLVVASTGEWHDDSLIVKLPRDFNQGYAVIWRDDIPSDVEHFVADDLQQDFRWLVGEAFQTTAAPLVIEAGNTCRISIMPRPNCDPAAASFRDYTLAQKGAGLKWDVAVSDAWGNKCGVDTYVAEVTYVPNKTGCAEIDVTFCPKAHCQERPDRMVYDQYAVQVVATECKIMSQSDGTIHDVGNCPFNLGAPLHLTQQSLPVPSIGVFYQDVNYSGVPLIVVPSTTKLGGGNLGNLHVDAQSDQIGTVVQSLMADLYYGANCLWGKLSRLGKAFPDSDLFQNAAGGIVNACGGIDSASQWVFDSTGALSTLENSVIESHWYGDNDFDDMISSAVIVGVPLSSDSAGRCVFRLSQDDNYTGTTLNFSVLGSMVAAVPSFCHMAQKDVDAPLPYSLSQDFDWNDEVTSIELVVYN
jgi:hypothetical protein